MFKRNLGNAIVRRVAIGLVFREILVYPFAKFSRT